MAVFVEAVPESFEALHNGLAAVTLAGSRKAAAASGAVYDKAWEIYRCSLQLSGPAEEGEMRLLRRQYYELMTTFINIARRELN